MTEKSGFWNTKGVSPVGDQLDGYNEIVWSDAASILASCSGFEGVGASLLNALEVTATDLNEVTVDIGGAVVDGKWYKNDAGKAVVIPSAVGGGNTRIDRIVLRCSWAGYTVRIHRIAGTDAGSPTAPAITQTSGTTYDIQLAQVLVDTSGNCVVTDERDWALPSLASSLEIVDGEISVKNAYPYVNYLVQVLAHTQLWAVGDGKFAITILDNRLDGVTLHSVRISCHTPSSSGTPTVQIARGRRASPSGAPSYTDVLSTKATIDAGEYTSIDAAVQPVISASSVELGDIFRFDIDVSGTGTKGLEVEMVFAL